MLSLTEKVTCKSKNLLLPCAKNTNYKTYKTELSTNIRFKLDNDKQGDSFLKFYFNQNVNKRKRKLSENRNFYSTSSVSIRREELGPGPRVLRFSFSVSSSPRPFIRESKIPENNPTGLGRAGGTKPKKF